MRISTLGLIINSLILEHQNKKNRMTSFVSESETIVSAYKLKKSKDDSG